MYAGGPNVDDVGTHPRSSSYLFTEAGAGALNQTQSSAVWKDFLASLLRASLLGLELQARCTFYHPAFPGVQESEPVLLSEQRSL